MNGMNSTKVNDKKDKMNRLQAYADTYIHT